MSLTSNTELKYMEILVDQWLQIKGYEVSFKQVKDNTALQSVEK